MKCVSSFPLLVLIWIWDETARWNSYLFSSILQSTDCSHHFSSEGMMPSGLSEKHVVRYIGWVRDVTKNESVVGQLWENCAPHNTQTVHTLNIVPVFLEWASLKKWVLLQRKLNKINWRKVDSMWSSFIFVQQLRASDGRWEKIFSHPFCTKIIPRTIFS